MAPGGLVARIPGLHPCCEWYMQSRFNRVRLFSTLWTVAHQAPLSMEFSMKNTGVDCPALLQVIFPTQGLTCVPCGSCIGRQVLYH